MSIKETKDLDVIVDPIRVSIPILELFVHTFRHIGAEVVRSSHFGNRLNVMRKDVYLRARKLKMFGF